MKIDDLNKEQQKAVPKREPLFSWLITFWTLRTPARRFCRPAWRCRCGTCRHRVTSCRPSVPHPRSTALSSVARPIEYYRSRAPLPKSSRAAGAHRPRCSCGGRGRCPSTARRSARKGRRPQTFHGSAAIFRGWPSRRGRGSPSGSPSRQSGWSSAPVLRWPTRSCRGQWPPHRARVCNCGTCVRRARCTPPPTCAPWVRPSGTRAQRDRRACGPWARIHPFSPSRCCRRPAPLRAALRCPEKS